MTIDLIGTLYEPIVVDETGVPVGDPVAMAGYHVNITDDELTHEIAPYVVTPTVLSRVFAGDNPFDPKWTIPLRFDDEAQARQILGLDP